MGITIYSPKNNKLADYMHGQTFQIDGFMIASKPLKIAEH
jgi:hypothetical protein